MSPVERAVVHLDMSLTAAKHTLTGSNAPLAERLTWLAVELERLAGEAYRLADDCLE